MKITRIMTAGSAVAAAALALSVAPAMADPAVDEHKDVTPMSVQQEFSDKEIAIMAKSSGRTISEQKNHLQEQETQNNAYAKLFSKGHNFDGAYFDENNNLVLNAKPGSKAAKAAEAAGLKVASPTFGEDRLTEITDSLGDALASNGSVASVVPDIKADTVVITVTNAKGEKAAKKAAAKFGEAVTIQRGEANTMQKNVKGGDKMMLGGGYCSAGFPANDGSKNYMVWAGHCLDGIDRVTDEGGSLVGTAADTKFKSYSGRISYDMGIVALADGVTLDGTINQYNARGAHLDATKGAWKAPIGTDTCKSGATSGITCGQVTGYGASVTYSDHQGRVQARVENLGTASICTASGDSGGAYVSGGYAVGMTSGGPSNQQCGFNGGYVDGTSYFQPVTDALETYNLEYGNISSGGGDNGGGDDYYRWW